MAILKDLIVHGSSRFLNKIYANELEVSAFEAESAIIKKLTAKDTILGNATVIGLLDVQGQLHTNTWTNSNIATIDGCFYITPTLSSDSGNIVFSSVNVASLTGDFTAVNSLYIGDSSSGSTVQWTKDSKILLTGEVEVNGQWLPLGTLLGTLSANAATNSIGLKELKDNRHNDSSIITDIRNAVSNTSLNYRNLKISLYQRKDGTDSKPLGIYMTAMGANGKTFIDIYGGVNATTTAGSSGGFADPNLRIGNLSGLGAVEGTTPTGWGIYTTNGYFKGVIVSSAGKIGNFTINSALYSNNHSAWNSNVSGIYINNDGISGGAGGKWWLWNDGSAKIGAMTLSAAGVLTVPAANVSGKLTAATIDGTQITANTITAGQIAASAITADELAANAVTSAKIKAGQVKATNIASSAVTADKLDATTINASNKLTVGALTTATQNDILNSNIQIGGRNLVLNSNNELSSKNAITTYSLSNYGISNIKGKKITISADIKSDTANTGLDVYIRASATSSAENDYTIINNIGTSYSRFSVVVTVYSNDHIPNQLAFRTTQINSAATFNIKNVKVELGNKVTDWSPAPEDIQDGIDDAAKTATTYITDIDSNKGITIKPADTSGNDYLQMNSSAINFYRNNVETLKIEDSAIRVGKLGSNLRNVYITNDVVQIRNNTSVLAEYGSSIKLYQPTTTTVAVEISSTGASFNGNVKATSLSTGNKTASTTGKGTYIDGNGNIYVGDGSSNNFTVTSAGAMTAKSGTIGKYTITSTFLYTGTGSTQAGIGGNQAFWAGGTDSNSAPFRVSYSGVLNATGATISGNITATSGIIGGASISEDGVLMIKDANISGKISASHIDVSSITIGSLSGADNYALKDDVPTTVAELTDSGSYLTTSAASSTYATQTNLNNEINARKAVYGTSSTDAGTATKVVTCSNFALYTGASVTVTFSKANTSSAPQLNINSTGAKSIKSYTGANLTEGEYKWVAGASITFTYDGTNWRMQDGGALQAKIDAASSASTASSQAGVATQQATNATNAKTAAESAKTAAESAKTAAQSAKTAAETASSQASSAKDAAVSAKNDAVSAKTGAETAKGQAQTAAGNASQSATNAANSATAAAEVMGGFTILWNYSAFGTSNNGRGYLCAFDPTTGTKSDANGWVKWNGTKRTITKQLINPSAISPYNIPVYVVCRLSSATATTGTNYMVWYNSGWKSATLSSPSTINNSWTWADNTDIILGKFVETASNAALTEYEIYNPPYTSKQITTNVVTAQSASASAASAAKTATSYITYVNATDGIKVHNASDTTNYLQLNSSAISMYKGGTKIFNTDSNGYVTVGKVDVNRRNVYITDDAVQIRNNTTVLAEYGSNIKLYKPGTTTTAVEISSTGATFTGGIVATSLTLESGVTIGYSSISDPPTIPTTVAELTDSGSYLTTTTAANTYATQTAANNAAQTASKYITAVDANGIRVHAENNPTTNYALINANGMSIYQNASGTAAKVADFNQDAVAFYDGNGNDDENIIALFGKDGGQVGYTSSNHLTFSSNSITAVSDIGAKLFSVGTNQATEQVLITKDLGTAVKVTSMSSSNPTSMVATLPITDEITDGALRIDYEWYGYSSDRQSTFRYRDTFEGVIGTAKSEDVHADRIGLHLNYSRVTMLGKQVDNFWVDAYKTSSYNTFFRVISVTYDGNMAMPTYDLGTRAVSSNFAGSFSSVIGESLFATGDRQVAIGKYNVEDTSDTYAFIVGNGNDDDNRSNALTVDWSGNLIASGGAAFNGNTSITGSLDITGSITRNNKSLFKKEDVTVTVTYAAGTIGSRACAISLGATVKSGYAYLGAYIFNNQSTATFSAIIGRNEDTGNAYLLVYRATGNAASDIQVKVRKIWVLNSLVST